MEATWWLRKAALVVWASSINSKLGCCWLLVAPRARKEGTDSLHVEVLFQQD